MSYNGLGFCFINSTFRLRKAAVASLLPLRILFMCKMLGASLGTCGKEHSCQITPVTPPSSPLRRSATRGVSSFITDLLHSGKRISPTNKTVKSTLYFRASSWVSKIAAPINPDLCFARVKASKNSRGNPQIIDILAMRGGITYCQTTP